jgi:hypothetical protein
MSNDNIQLEKYSEKSFVVRGVETKTFKDDLKETGGKWNSFLKGGAGWIFSLNKLQQVLDILKTKNVKYTNNIGD